MGCCLGPSLYPTKAQCQALKGHADIYDIFTIVDDIYISPCETDIYYQMLSAIYSEKDKLLCISSVLRITRPKIRITKNILYAMLKVKMYSELFGKDELKHIEKAAREREVVLLEEFEGDVQVKYYIKAATDRYIDLSQCSECPMG